MKGELMANGLPFLLRLPAQSVVGEEVEEISDGLVLAPAGGFSWISWLAPGSGPSWEERLGAGHHDP
jgi:hypothetical protein